MSPQWSVGPPTYRMPYNLTGPDDAIVALAKHVEDLCSTDPTFPWTFVRTHEGPVLDGDGGCGAGLETRLLDVSRVHPEVTLTTTSVDIADDRWTLTHIVYRSGTKAVIGTLSFELDDLRDQRVLRRIERLTGLRLPVR